MQHSAVTDYRVASELSEIGKALRSIDAKLKPASALRPALVDGPRLAHEMRNAATSIPTEQLDNSTLELLIRHTIERLQL